MPVKVRLIEKAERPVEKLDLRLIKQFLLLMDFLLNNHLRNNQ